MNMQDYRDRQRSLEALAREQPATRTAGGWSHPLTGDKVFPRRSMAEVAAWASYHDRLKAEAARSCANWLHAGQPVEVIWDKGRLDGRCLEGRKGVVLRRCSVILEDHCYILLPRRGREKRDKEIMVHILQIAPICEADDEAA